MKYLKNNEGIGILKSIIYKYRVLFAILLCVFTLLLGTYFLTHNKGFLSIVLLVPLNILNRKILGNGTDSSNKENMFLLFSGLVIAGVFLFLNYNITVSKIISK